MTSPLLTSQAAAEYLHHAPRTLIRWRNERRGPTYIRVGKKVLYSKSDLDKWLESNRVEMVRGGAA